SLAVVSTTTVSLISPIFNDCDTSAMLPTSACTRGATLFRNPLASISTLYSPGRMDSKEYVPADPVVSVLERFVCKFVMVTVTPGKAAPEESVIVPRIVDVPNCPQTRVPDRRIINR